MSAKIPWPSSAAAAWAIATCTAWPSCMLRGYPRLNWSAHATPISTTPTRWPTKRSSASARAPKPLPAQELASLGDVQAVDICTLPAHHHSVAVEAMERGWHVLCEKPVGLTTRACKLMREASERTGCILSVAENYRRDPINRLAKALLDVGAIGTPRLMMHNTIGGGDRMLISVWRHQKNASGVLLDVGVHFTDIMEFFLGDALSVRADAPARKDAYQPHGRRHRRAPDIFIPNLCALAKRHAGRVRSHRRRRQLCNDPV